MIIIAIVVGILLLAILIVHTFLTGNTIEKNSVELQDELNKYYIKNEIVDTEEQE